MSSADPLLAWLREACSTYAFEPRAILRRSSREKWPLTARDYEALEEQLGAQGSLAALPREPAAIANVIEVSVADHLLRVAKAAKGVETRRGKERHYPDLEVAGPAFGNRVFAVDIKVARRTAEGKRTKSRISLYTGNTYFRYPDLKWPLTLRPFGEYAGHVDVVALYSHDPASLSGILDPELVAQETWRFGSRERSSTTREYIGAVTSVEAIRKGEGEFADEAEFLSYWRKFDFKIGKAVQKQLDKLLAERRSRRS